MEVNIGKAKDYQGIWKESEDSPCATFHGYGFFNAEIKHPKLIKTLVMHDLWVKLSHMSSESTLPTEGLFNYDRFFKRFGIECLVSIFKDYEEVGDFDYNDFSEFHGITENGKFRDFFGEGEFPFVHYGIITRENGDKYIVYFLSR